MSRVQEQGEMMHAEQGFLGVPVRTFDEGGRRQFIALLREGLNPESRVLEIGCGCLRVAYWLIRLLDADRYCGIEPHEGRVAWGRKALFSAEELAAKRPRFDHNDQFEAGSFGERFDFFLAGSIWTHCAKSGIEKMLDEFVRHSSPDAVFLASWLPARTPEEDYQGDGWVGTSHMSDAAGVVRHRLGWIREAAAAQGLAVERPATPAFDDQFWLRIRRKDRAPLAERLDGAQGARKKRQQGRAAARKRD